MILLTSLSVHRWHTMQIVLSHTILVVPGPMGLLHTTPSHDRLPSSDKSYIISLYLRDREVRLPLGHLLQVPKARRRRLPACRPCLAARPIHQGRPLEDLESASALRWGAGWEKRRHLPPTPSPTPPLCETVSNEHPKIWRGYLIGFNKRITQSASTAEKHAETPIGPTPTPNERSRRPKGQLR